MRSLVWTALALYVLWGAAPAVAHSQTVTAMDPALCDQLGSMPSSSMTPETCRAMAKASADMEAAINGPEGRRSGDEAMSCRDIELEMGAMTGIGVSDAVAAEGEAAARDLEAEAAKAQSRGMMGGKPDPALLAAQRRSMAASAATLTEMAAQMKANPRFARLSGLAMEKACRAGG